MKDVLSLLNNAYNDIQIIHYIAQSIIADNRETN